MILNLPCAHTCRLTEGVLPTVCVNLVLTLCSRLLGWLWLLVTAFKDVTIDLGLVMRFDQRTEIFARWSGYVRRSRYQIAQYRSLDLPLSLLDLLDLTPALGRSSDRSLESSRNLVNQKTCFCSGYVLSQLMLFLRVRYRSVQTMQYLYTCLLLLHVDLQTSEGQ